MILARMVLNKRIRVALADFENEALRFTRVELYLDGFGVSSHPVICPK